MLLNGVFAMSRGRWTMLRSSGLTVGTCHYFFPERGVGKGGEGSEDFGCLTKKFAYSPFKAL